MKKLSSEQKKIIYITSVAVLFFLIFWILIYLPQSRRLKDIKRKLESTQEEINQIKRMAEGKTLEETVKDLSVRLNQAVARLPLREENIIKILSDDAKQLKIDVRMMDPADAVKALSVAIPGFNLKELPISMQLVCEYRALGEYLDILRNRLPFLVRVNQLIIQGNGEGNPSLNVRLEISVYLSEQAG